MAVVARANTHHRARRDQRTADEQDGRKRIRDPHAELSVHSTSLLRYVGIAKGHRLRLVTHKRLHPVQIHAGHNKARRERMPFMPHAA
jgi:hypothetical protein